MHVFLRRKSLEQTCYFQKNPLLHAGNEFPWTEWYYLSHAKSYVWLFLRQRQPQDPKAKGEEKYNWLNIHLTQITPHPWKSGFPFNTESGLLRPELISFTHLCHIYILNFWPHLAVALIRRRVSRTVKHSEKDLNRKTSITCWFYPNLPVPFSKEGLMQGST